MSLFLRQQFFDFQSEVESRPESRTPVEAMASDARGMVFTRAEVVNFILDLVGYQAGRPLPGYRMLEPSFGKGDFLLAIIDRLLEAWRRTGDDISPLALADSIRAVELDPEMFSATRLAVIARLEREGFTPETALELAGHWLRQGDYLLLPSETDFDFVVGNPPYVRQERIPEKLLNEYRRRYATLYDRADLYVPFLERSLLSLKDGGVLGFICPDRWMKNRYGGPLRNLIARHFNLRIFVDMTDTPAFQSEVSAYPAIVVIGREASGATRAASRPIIEVRELNDLAQKLTADRVSPDERDIRELARVPHGDEPWLLEAGGETEVIRRLERQFPLLEETGCQVGIGVATGADKAFIGDFESLNVEPDRKLPLVTTRDIESGEVRWRGQGVINPFLDGGGLVNLRDYPRLAAYLNERRDVIAARHCARKNPAQWYRTIDRVTPALAGQPKLLIPDIKGDTHIVLESGEFYPHHNLYYIVSRDWDLRALRTVLRSRITRLFIATYSTKMRGGYLRFQAQYLRRIRLPRWIDVPETLRRALTETEVETDAHARDEAVFRLYGLTDKERDVLGGQS